MSAFSLIQKYGADFEITRPGEQTVVRGGGFEAADPTTFTARLSVQPAQGKDIQALPEGLREKDAKRIYTTTELRGGGTEFQAAGDRFEWEGRIYAIFKVAPGDGTFKRNLSHWKCIALRVEQEV